MNHQNENHNSNRQRLSYRQWRTIQAKPHEKNGAEFVIAMTSFFAAVAVSIYSTYQLHSVLKSALNNTDYDNVGVWLLLSITAYPGVISYSGGLAGKISWEIGFFLYYLAKQIGEPCAVVRPEPGPPAEDVSVEIASTSIHSIWEDDAAHISAQQREVTGVIIGAAAVEAAEAAKERIERLYAAANGP